MKILVKLLPADMGFVNYSRLKFSPTFSESRSCFQEVLNRSTSSLINAIIKYLNFPSSCSNLESTTCKVSKNCLYSVTKISLQVQGSNIEKCTLMAASDDNFISQIFLNGCFPRTAASQGLLQRYVYCKF